jgi:hypothetical protein
MSSNAGAEQQTKNHVFRDKKLTGLGGHSKYVSGKAEK